MAKEKTTKKAKTDEVPTPTPASTVKGEQDWRPGEAALTYVVIRYTYGIDIRVSDKEYLAADDAIAISERDFWNRAIKFRPDGTRAEIVKYDKRKHRTW